MSDPKNGGEAPNCLSKDVDRGVSRSRPDDVFPSQAIGEFGSTKVVQVKVHVHEQFLFLLFKVFYSRFMSFYEF